MVNQTSFNQLQQQLTSAKTILNYFSAQTSFDQVAAGLAWFLALKAAGKQVTAYSLAPMTVEFSHLVGVDKIGQQIGGKNLTVILDLEESIENVSYHTDEKHLYLVIEPKEGQSAPSSETVQFSYSGGQVDLVFNFGQIEEGQLKDLAKSPVVDLFQLNPQAASVSEIVAWVLSKTGLPVNEDIASNLLAGLQQATQNFSSPQVAASTFEAAAFCLRAGGQRSKLTEAKTMPIKTPPVIDQQPQADWLAPKIYKGNQLI